MLVERAKLITMRDFFTIDSKGVYEMMEDKNQELEKMQERKVSLQKF